MISAASLGTVSSTSQCSSLDAKDGEAVVTDQQHVKIGAHQNILGASGVDNGQAVAAVSDVQVSLS